MQDLAEKLQNIEIADSQTVINHKKKYPKKSFIELIDSLIEKNIKFNNINRDDAIEIIQDVNYYYKLTVYKKNFSKDESGNYIDLDFSYLNDIEKVDTKIRYILLISCLELENALKTFLLKEITNNISEDGYDIVNKFFNSTNSTTKSNKALNKDIILEKIKAKDNYQYKIYKTHSEAIPVWVLMEVISFGDFLRFFEFYFTKYKKTEINIKSMMGVLNGVRKIRNCSAHNNPFLYQLSNRGINNVSGYITKYSESKGIGPMFYSCTKVHDVICIFYLYEWLVKENDTKVKFLNSFKSLINEYESNLSYLDKYNDIVYFFNILKLIVDKNAI